MPLWRLPFSAVRAGRAAPTGASACGKAPAPPRPYRAQPSLQPPTGAGRAVCRPYGGKPTPANCGRAANNELRQSTRAKAVFLLRAHRPKCVLRLARGRFCFLHLGSVFVSPCLRRPACPLYPTILHNNPTAGSRAVRLSVYCALVPSVALPTLHFNPKGSGRAAYGPFGFAPFFLGTGEIPCNFCLRPGVLCPSGWSGFFFFVLLSDVLFFFVSLSLVFSSLLWVLLCSLRLLPWWLLLGSLPCVRCSLVSCSASPRGAHHLPRCAWPLRVQRSRVPWSVGACALGRWVGRWLPWLPGLGVCRCCPVVFPLPVFSFLCFLKFF